MPSIYLSKRFTLSDFTRTSTGASNVVPNAQVMSNLKRLAATLEQVFDVIGPFDILSAYRSQETQDALRASGNVQAVRTSFHTQGIAADIKPTRMRVEDYALKILNNKTIRYKLGQIAIKGNSLHVSLPTPEFQGQFMIVEPSGAYVRKPDDSFVTAMKARLGEAVALVQENKGGIGLLLASIAFAAFMFLRRKK